MVSLLGEGERFSSLAGDFDLDLDFACSKGGGGGGGAAAANDDDAWGATIFTDCSALFLSGELLELLELVELDELDDDVDDEDEKERFLSRLVECLRLDDFLRETERFREIDFLYVLSSGLVDRYLLDDLW